MKITAEEIRKIAEDAIVRADVEMILKSTAEVNIDIVVKAVQDWNTNTKENSKFQSLTNYYRVLLHEKTNPPVVKKENEEKEKR